MVNYLVKFLAFVIIICNFCILYRIYYDKVFDDLVCVTFSFTFLLLIIGLADFMLHYKDSFCEYLSKKYKD